MPSLNKEEPYNKDKNKKKEREKAPLNLDYNIKELEFNQQEADKSNKSFLIKGGVIMAGQHCTARNKILELLGARIIRVMTAYRRIGP